MSLEPPASPLLPIKLERGVERIFSGKPLRSILPLFVRSNILEMHSHRLNSDLTSLSQPSLRGGAGARTKVGDSWLVWVGSRWQKPVTYCVASARHFLPASFLARSEADTITYPRGQCRVMNRGLSPGDAWRKDRGSFQTKKVSSH